MKDRGCLNKRELLCLILSTIERVELKLSAASEYMTAALESLDVQMNDLRTRLTGDAQTLADAIAALNLSQADSAALTAAADRVQATAVLVAGLAQPTAVADENQPDVTVDPIPAEAPATDAPAEQDPAFPQPGA